MPIKRFIFVLAIGRFTVGRLIDKHSIQSVMRFFAALGGVGYFSGLLIANALHERNSHSALVVMCLTYAILGLGLAPMAPSFASIAGAIPGIPTARAVARMQMISAFGFFFGRGMVSLFTKFVGLPVALLFPALALVLAGQISFRLHPEKLTQ